MRIRPNVVREEEFEALQDSGGVEGPSCVAANTLQSSRTLKDSRRFAFF